MYPVDLLDEDNSGIAIGGRKGTAITKGTSSQNQLQLPESGISLSDNTLARDNSSMCQITDKRLITSKTICCLCCFHLNNKTAVFIAVAIGLGLNFSGLLFYSIQGQFNFALPSLLSCLLYLSVLFAQYRRRSAWFLPFLTINAFFLSLWACLGIYLAIIILVLPDWCVQLVIDYFEWEELDQLLGIPSGTERIRSKARLFLSISLAFTLVYLLIECWIWWIVWRGYKAVKNCHIEEWLQNLSNNIRSISIY